MMDIRKKKIINVIGMLIIVVSLVFLAHSFLQLEIKPAYFLTPVNISMVITMPFLSVIAYFCSSICWGNCLQLFSKEKIPVGDTYHAYSKANIMKYLPGNVGQYLGRQFYGAKLGVSQSGLAAASLMEIVYNVGALLLCAFIFSAQTTIDYLKKQFTLTWFFIICGLLVVTVLAVAYFRNNEHVYRALSIIKRIDFLKTMLLGVMLLSLAECVISLECVILMSQYVQLDFDKMLLILSATIVSIFVGYITPGVPGGIGVREAVLLAMLSSSFPEEAILLTVLVHRVIMIIGDLINVPISSLLATGDKPLFDSRSSQ